MDDPFWSKWAGQKHPAASHRCSSFRPQCADNARALELIKRTVAEKLFPEKVALEITAKSAMLRTANGEPISFFDLSDGYRSMLALSIDLLRWIIKAFPQEEDPLRCTGVVVIDELDAHLHPSWQRTIGDWIRDKFPNIQFIITTHSPFVAHLMMRLVIIGSSIPRQKTRSHTLPLLVICQLGKRFEVAIRL